MSHIYGNESLTATEFGRLDDLITRPNIIMSHYSQYFFLAKQIFIRYTSYYFAGKLRKILKEFVVHEKAAKIQQQRKTPQLFPKSTFVPVHFRFTYRSARYKGVAPPSM